MISYLHGDHIWPYSLFGETTWDNYQLICGDCNLNKSNRLDVDVREALGADEFRQRVRDFLMEQVEGGNLAEDAVVRDLLGRPARGAASETAAACGASVEPHGFNVGPVVPGKQEAGI